jgi:acetyl-CoA C-acetyltransferase
MVHDGLWDPYNNCHMGMAAERCNEMFKITREDQDRYSEESCRCALLANEKGALEREIVPVTVSTRSGPQEVNMDEELARIDLNKLSQLRPAFQKDGTVTAGNASSISDGKGVCVGEEGTLTSSRCGSNSHDNCASGKGVGIAHTGDY